jgi:hypothetical protein
VASHARGKLPGVWLRCVGHPRGRAPRSSSGQSAVPLNPVAEPFDPGDCVGCHDDAASHSLRVQALPRSARVRTSRRGTVRSHWCGGGPRRTNARGDCGTDPFAVLGRPAKVDRELIEVRSITSIAAATQPAMATGHRMPTDKSRRAVCRKSHARFEVAAGGNQDSGRRCAAQAPLADPCRPCHRWRGSFTRRRRVPLSQEPGIRVCTAAISFRKGSTAYTAVGRGT